ncbi:MAG TPA: electron transport complex subunit E [Candidatus Gemmiger stercoripullorum]|nr:electron transport complex subunit E [Candidatus Gemmiger stercoripullorum]
MAEKQSKWKIFTAGILRENPVLRLVLGCCSALAITTTVSGAIGMGLSMTFVLVCSNIVISALRKAIPDKVHLPCYIVIIAAFVTIVQMVLQAYVPDLYESLGVFLALIVVNCIILGRAEMFACKHTVVESALDGLGMGLGYILTMTLMSSIREILGNGSWMGIQIIPESVDRMGIMNQAPGGFFVFGCLMALCIYIERKLNRPIERKTCGDVMLEELEAAKAENGEGGDQA